MLAGGSARARREQTAGRVRALLGAESAAPPDPPQGVPGEPRGGPGRLRWQPERRAVGAVAVAVLVAAALTLWWVLSSRPREVAVHTSVGTPVAGANSAPEAATSPAPSAAATVVVVDVAGKVRRPGVYRLAAGSRVIDAIRVAGGALPGVSTTSINLAAPLRDGQQVVVGVPGAAPPADPAQSGGGGGGDGPVNLNSATREQLDGLPGVGPVLAQNILDWRAQHGRFGSVRELGQVTGIGPAKLALLTPLVTV